MQTINTEAGNHGVSVALDDQRATVTVTKFALVEMHVSTFSVPNLGGVLVTEVPGFELAWVQADDSVWPWDSDARLFLSRTSIPEHLHDQCVEAARTARAKGRAFAHFGV